MDDKTGLPGAAPTETKAPEPAASAADDGFICRNTGFRAEGKVFRKGDSVDLNPDVMRNLRNMGRITDDPHEKKSIAAEIARRKKK